MIRAPMNQGRRAPRAHNAPLRKAGAEITERRLENGMRLIVAERRSDPVVAVLLFYKVGARNESEREAGVSHFLEHMMFKGSRRYGKGEVDRLTASLGGSNNAFTSNDHTAYWFEFASDRWETALDIELDRMRHLTLDPKEFAAEREVVLEELAMGEDDPWRVLMRHVEAAVFPRHPYGRPVIGYGHTLKGLTVSDMRAYHARFYHPGNATLVVSGDVAPSDALAAVAKRFGRVPSGPPYAEADAFRGPIEPLPGMVRLRTSWDDPGKRLCMAWQTVPVASADDDALDLLLAALVSGRASRLQHRLVHEERLATSVSAVNDTRVEGGAFWLLAECAQGTAPETLERAIDEELERLRKRPLGAAEVQRAREILRSAEALEVETASDLAEELGEWAVDADWRLTIDADARLRRLRPADLRACAARLLDAERRVVGWSLPRS
jgi:zinc protease